MTAGTLTPGGLTQVEQPLMKFRNFFRLGSSVSLKKRNKIPNSTNREKNKNTCKEPVRKNRGSNLITRRVKKKESATEIAIIITRVIMMIIFTTPIS